MTDFGLFGLLGRRDRDKDIGAVIREATEHARLGEQAGFSTAWFAEHHFSNYSLTVSPLMMAAHLAAVTKTIRLGTSVVLGCLYQPARLIGEVAFVDQMCGGRLVLGVGSGYQAQELVRFGVTLEQSREMTAEMLEILDRGLTNGFIEFNGKHFRFPATELSVLPVQRPRPPIWFAGNSPESCAIAANNDYTLFASGFGRPVDTLVQVRRDAEASWRAAGHDPAKMRLAILRYGFVTDSKAEALAYAENARYQLRQSRYLRQGQTALPGAFLPEEGFDGEMSPEDILANNPIGDAEMVAEKLAAEVAATNAVHIGLYMCVGRASHASVLKSIEAFGAKVLPALEKARVAARPSVAAG